MSLDEDLKYGESKLFAAKEALADHNLPLALTRLEEAIPCYERADQVAGPTDRRGMVRVAQCSFAQLQIAYGLKEDTSVYLERCNQAASDVAHHQEADVRDQLAIQLLCIDIAFYHVREHDKRLDRKSIRETFQAASAMLANATPVQNLHYQVLIREFWGYLFED